MVLVFSLISFSIDFSEKIDDFIEEKLSIGTIIFDYYINFIPYINGQLFPMYALIAVIFFTSRMAFNSEIIAILNSGASFWRVARPYFIGAFILTTIHLIGNHWVIPNGGKKQIPFENKYIWKHDSESKTRNISLYIDSTQIVHIRNYSLYDSSARDFEIETISNGELVSNITAKRAEWQSETGKWRLFTYRTRKLEGLRETITTGAMVDTLINLYPGDLERRSNIRWTMTSPELYDFILRERSRGAGNYSLYEVELHRRTSEPFTIVILTLIGLAIAGRKIRGGIGLHLAIGVSIGATYILLTKFAATFSTSGGVPPFLGVWIPNIIYLLLTIYLIRGAQK